jgi:hypothetical protein
LAAEIGSHPDIRQPYFEFFCRVLEKKYSTGEMMEIEHWEVVKDSISQGISDTNQTIRTVAIK